MEPAPAPDELDGWFTSAYARRATRRRVQRSAGLVVLAGAAGVGLLVFAFVLWAAQRSLSSLDDQGTRTEASVTEVAPRVVARERHVIGDVKVSYAAGSARHEHTFFVNTNVTRYQVGDTVEVAYDPKDPSVVNLTGDAAASRGKIPWEVMAAVGLMVAVMAAAGARHVFLTRRILRRHEWLAVPAMLASTPRGLRSRGGSVVQLGERSSPERIVAEAMTLRALPANIGPVAWVAGWGEKRFVVAPAGGSPALLARRLSDLGADPVDAVDEGWRRDRGVARG